MILAEPILAKDGLSPTRHRHSLAPCVPSGTPIGTSPRLYTAHPNYLWLNRLHCVGVGQAFLERGEAAYDVYAVR
jgi:hypothetical protein